MQYRHSNQALHSECLTATPINNSIRDLYSLYRLMTRDRDELFATTKLRIRSLRAFFRDVEKMGISTIDLLLEKMVCRSRLDIRRRQENGEVTVISEKEVRFPSRHMVSLEYGLVVSGDTVRYDELAATIEKLTLGAYSVEQYSNSSDAQKNQTRNGRIDRLFSPHADVTTANFFPEGGLSF